MTERDRRTLMLGGLVMAAGLLARTMTAGAGLVIVFARERDLTARLVQEARRRVAELPGLEDSAGALRRAFIGLAPQLLEARTEADALTELARRLTSLAGRVAARLETVTREVDSTRSGQLGRVSIRAAFDTNARGLIGALRVLGTGPTAITPEWIQVVAADPFGGAASEEHLRVELISSAWFLEARR